MSDKPLVLHFTDELCRDVELSGGKGASLATMTQEGLPVPPGFVVTSPAFAEAVDGAKLLECLRTRDLEGARAVVAQAQPPRELIEAAYRRLPTGASVAVRSSACAEDGNDASYAGQQETYLFVEGGEEVCRRVVDCWASFFSERALFYRSQKGSLEDLRMAVVVQKMVDPEKSGVIFTVDPVRRRRDRMVVEAVRGIGERVVSGEVTPDHYALDRKGKVKREKVVDDRVLTDDELQRLGDLGRQLEERHGVAQDIEWAMIGEEIYLLQSRPVTTM